MRKCGSVICICSDSVGDSLIILGLLIWNDFEQRVQALITGNKLPWGSYAQN